MVMQQCLKCKNSNPQCRQSFVVYYGALNMITELVNDGNRDSKFFKEKENQRHYDFIINCSHFIPKEDKGEK